jgi:hypothetical protein
VCEMTSGCSWISFSMKWRRLPLSTMKLVDSDCWRLQSTF